MAANEINMKTFHDVKDFFEKKMSGSLATQPKSLSLRLYSLPPLPKNKCDLVYEGIYLGEASIALKPAFLRSLGVTHVVNVSQGKKINQTNTSSEYYKDTSIIFHGIPAVDIATFSILPYLRPAADFIHQAQKGKGMVYVHCQQGVSRSATVVLAYLMLYKKMSLMNAVHAVLEKREIHPNDGFLKQLCILEKEIQTTSAS